MGGDGAATIIRRGETCWRREPAERAALLVDNDAYFRAVRDALPRARHSIRLVGWTFDPRTRLGPPDGDAPTIADLLNELVRDRPELDIRLLIWEAAAVIAATQEFFPQRARDWLDPSIRLHLDDRHPVGASHHAKVLTIDDSLAFCSGEDFSVERWDTADHRDEDGRRRLPSGEPSEPRHGVSFVCDGGAARALAEFACERWREATGEPSAVAEPSEATPWPAGVEPDFAGVDVAVARTLPAMHRREAAREGEKLFLAAIAAARDLIYIENQYFASPEIANALAARLEDEDGPEIVLICSPRSAKFFDQLTMDPVRDVLIGRLRAANRHGRLSILAPFTERSRRIVVHSKLMIVDDRFLRVGSSNLNGRSMRLDSECDIAIDVGDDADDQARIRRIREGLVAHFLGRRPDEARSAERRLGGLSPAIDMLDDGAARRLRSVEAEEDRQIVSMALEKGLTDPAELAQPLSLVAENGNRRIWRRLGMAGAGGLLLFAAARHLVRRRRR